ncbi:hypothetical protein [Roseovarius pelagicus]|uniref:Uncharacterized protein n=1 Tax=Roseovarius pelagicus TaxID=2980108 RepID=A0ABY6DDW3_9RHOB|nr:hypothetical protein [Roseovarius pelagicus]UXX84352.1 hypothetical protein N7U68_06820 [Roseovarius pelagicus]
MVKGVKSAKKGRTVRNFPASTFVDAEEFAHAVFDVGGGQAVKRLTLFDQMGKSPDSGPSRMMITNSGKYGLTTGSYKAEEISLTSDGLKVVSEQIAAREKERARIDLAILGVTPFKGVYESLIGNKLPASAVLEDRIKEFGVADGSANEAVDTLIVNLRDVGLLKTLSGAERVITVDARLDELPATSGSSNLQGDLQDSLSTTVSPAATMITSTHASYEASCFYITPIGQPGSPERKHADMFATSIVEPALKFSKLKLVRADEIESPGLITKQIIEYLVHSRLVVADLSFHNPNVFYELAVRHMLRKPTVQIMRKIDRLPFDVAQNRTVIIDEEDKYDLIAKMPTFIADLSAQARQALEADTSDNPISVFVPGLQSKIIMQ